MTSVNADSDICRADEGAEFCVSYQKVLKDLRDGGRTLKWMLGGNQSGDSWN